MQSDKKKFAAREALRQQARPQTPVRTATPPTPPVPPVRPQQSNSQNGGNGEGTQEKKKKSNRGVIIISLIFAFLVCGIFYYFYDSANKNKELEAYEYAMQSSDPMVLQSYLDTYKDADEAHRDSIMAHLELLKQTDQDWTNAVVSGSKRGPAGLSRQIPKQSTQAGGFEQDRFHRLECGKEC